MPAPFPLAGLLRLRRLREDTAAGELAAANVLTRAATARRARAQGDLSALGSNASDADSLRALSAARASSAAMLADLQALAAMHTRRSVDAEKALGAAHALTRSVEKLEDKHTEASAAAELRDEQLALDEIASRMRVGQKRIGTQP
jgi:flagellar FliJ protein